MIIRPITLATFLSILLQSCGPLVYTNYGPNVPLLGEKGETALSGAMNITMSDVLDDNLTGISLSAATAVGNNVALTGAFHYSGGESEDDWKRRSTYWELGGGWFKPGVGKPLIFEVFGGAGFGGINNTSPAEGALDVRFIKPYIQPTIGWKFKLVDLALTSRFAYVDYTSQRGAVIDQESFAGRGGFSWDPALTFRVGKTVRFQYQMCYSTFQTTSDNYYYEYYGHNWYFAAGVSARLKPKPKSAK